MVKKYLKFFIVGILIGIFCVTIFKFYQKSQKEVVFKRNEPFLKREDVFISQVIDGDTIRLSDGRSIRLIGVDTPELHHPELPVQYFANEASEFTKKLCEKSNVTIEYENNARDVYNRMLAYVYLSDGRCLNQELIKRGYGYVYTRFPFSKKDEFLALEKTARADQRGMWTHSPRDARVAGIMKRYDMLNEEGKSKFDTSLDELIKQYPSKNKEN